ncbi:hypothetical protein E143388_07379 [Rhodococcus opacus]|nr:hypothetical protein E143388_07379 [Rhodococcus opacus]
MTTVAVSGCIRVAETITWETSRATAQLGNRQTTEIDASTESGVYWCLAYDPMESGVPLDVGFVRGGHIGPAATEKWKFPAPTDRSRVRMTAAGLS